MSVIGQGAQTFLPNNPHTVILFVCLLGINKFSKEFFVNTRIGDKEVIYFYLLRLSVVGDQSCWLLCISVTGHGGTGEVQNNHYSVLPRCYGLHPDVRRHKWGVLQRCNGLVSISSKSVLIDLGVRLFKCYLMQESSVVSG